MKKKSEKSNFWAPPKPFKIAEFDGTPFHVLQPITLSLVCNLKAVNSPLLRVVEIMAEEVTAATKEAGEATGQMIEKGASEKIRQRLYELKVEPEQIAETIFIFITEPMQARDLLSKGRDKFKEMAMKMVADKLDNSQIARLQSACAQHYISSFVKCQTADKGEVT